MGMSKEERYGELKGEMSPDEDLMQANRPSTVDALEHE